MAITILSDRIQIGNSYLMESSTGLLFTGEVNAKNTVAGINGQGLTSGYSSGGLLSPPIAGTSRIDQFPFATNAPATNVGSLSVIRQGAAGQSSPVSGYTSGGSTVTPLNPPAVASNIIDKFPFASNGTATDVGDLTVARGNTAGQSSSTTGYSSGGAIGNVIDSFPFASDANATDVGDLTAGRYGAASQSSETFGYTSGGGPLPPPSAFRIDKFPFATNANATTVGNLSQARISTAGTTSFVSGYTSGGLLSPAPTQLNLATIDKFPFATDTSASFVGTLTLGRVNIAAQSSLSMGYSSGGIVNPSTLSNTIDSFPFATDANASSVGNLSQARQAAAGQQV